MRAVQYILKRLKANTEQSNAGENYYEDKRCDWFVKPRIRGDRDFIVNPNNRETDICRIYVFKQDGTNEKEITPTTIKAKHFLDNQGEYNGGYMEEFYFDGSNNPPRGIKFTGELGDKYIYKARGTCQNDTGLENKSDIQVYWYANCDMWIDYVKVENDVAEGLLNPNSPNYNTFNQWIKDEVEQIAFAGDPGAVPPMLKFYIELTEFNNLPCAAYVNQKLKEYSDSCSGGSYSVDLMADFTNLNMVHVPWDKRNTISSPGWVYTNYVQKVGLTQFFAESYPLTSLYTNPSQTWSKIPETLPTTSGWGILANPTTTAAYDTWLQDNMDHSPYVLETGEAGANIPFSYRSDNCNEYTLYQDEGNYRWIMNLGNEISRLHNIPFIFMPQDHLWYTKGEVRREPTNEELDLMANVSVSYGARGLMWFYFHSEAETTNPCTRYARGILDVNNNFRTENVYRQGHQYQQPYKWEVIRDISQRMKAWEPYIMSFDNANRHSYIYRIERSNLSSETYFHDVVSYIRGNDHPICDFDSPDTTDAPAPPNLKYECFEDRYLQVATFKKGVTDPDNYFMIVNRRCSPLQTNHDDGERFVRVFFDRNSQQLETFNNWSIIDIETGNVISVINIANVTPYADLGWFNPGEGKLYKMVSTLKSGGILAGDENITDESFTCEAPVYNNGFNITIGANTTIHFNDSSKFVMSGGVFTVGDQNTSAPQNITSDAVSGSSWKGHSFTNCEVKIYGATFAGLANDTTYAVNIIDCPVVDIRNCTFNTNSSLKGGVNAICFDNPFIAINSIYIGSNTFNSSGSTIPTVNVSSYAGITTPLIVENNTFNEGNTAVFLSGVIGGAIKGNTITDNYIGINALTSSIDVVQNNISSTVSGSMGIFAAGGSELKLN